MKEFHKYIGIPFVDRSSSFNGCDCFGLFRLVYKEELGNTINTFEASCTESRKIWGEFLRRISENWYLVNDYEKYDIVAMAYDPQHPRIVTHFGIYLGDGMMLHTLQGIGSFTCKISEFSYCIKGVYRWKN